MTVRQLKNLGYLSLKWQALISVSLVLIISFSLLAYSGKRNLEQTFTSERERVFQNRQRTVTASLGSIKLQLQRIAEHLQGQARSQSSSDPKQALIQTLNNNWQQVNNVWGVDSISLLDENKNMTASWGEPLDLISVPQEWFAQVKQSNEPLSRVWCQGDCSQLVIIPTHFGPSNPGLLLLTASLTDALAYFHSNTDANIGVLVKQNTIHPNSRQSATNSDYQLAALTGTPKSLDQLQHFSQDHEFSKVIGKRTNDFWQKEFYEFSFIPLEDTNSNLNAQLIVIDNVHESMQALQSKRNYLLIVSVGALLATELVLIAMLWLPMMRLQTLAKAMPLIASNSRQQIYQLLQPVTQKTLVKNEIHNLYDATVGLSQTLEELDKIVESRTQRLKNRSQDLLKERNFITSLLNNVHIAIVTQDYNSRIQLINSEAQNLLAIEEENFPDTLFTSKLCEQDKQQFFAGIEQLKQGTAQEFSQELDIVDAHSQPKHTEWYHSLLPAAVAEENLILSVGLDLTARKVAETNLAWLADHDPLTELYNRRRFQNEFKRILAESPQVNDSGALIFFDIDQFKTVNDTSGHPMGDQLLREISNKLKQHSNEFDLVARLGGDEFAIVKQHCSQSSAEDFAKRFCEIAKSIKFYNNGSTHNISLSIGIALYPQHGKNTEELMANADLAMYKAKSDNNARSSWHTYSSLASDKAELYARVTWKRKIEQALENNRFELYFQPILDIHGEKVSHFETLLRMRDDYDEVISPGSFIAIAESSGLINEIDVLVVTLAITALSEFHKIDSEISLSVNLSAKAVSNKNFLSIVEAATRDILVDKSKLIFELTETSAVEDLNTAITQIQNFRNLGYKFALDDFGVGFSSWYYLRQLPVDYVKIDGSFVRNLAKNIEDRLFVKAINDVAQGLGKHTIAEFVEDQYALALLSAMGVNYAQGYEIGRPQPLRETLLDFCAA